MPTPLPTFYLSHGGGPWPWVEGMIDGPYSRLASSLSRMVLDVGGAPKAMLMISAHWEMPVFTVQGHSNPSMIYDYYGFPEHTYHIHYDAPGDPALAKRAVALLEAAKIPAAVDDQRGYDHGMYAPLAVAYPDAKLPVVQLSLRRGLDPAAHVALGRALAPLREEGVLIVGSGLSYHNLRAFGPQGKAPSAAFDAWLHQSLALPHKARLAALLQWEAAPAARLAHPREEHLLPLMVALGAAEQEAAQAVYHETDFMGSLTVSSFRFGEAMAR
ncbi:MAG: dioxygenase [Firmicutes bacterium]|nr:dioxygenase [Bacillota bacterium]